MINSPEVTLVIAYLPSKLDLQWDLVGLDYMGLGYVGLGSYTPGHN